MNNEVHKIAACEVCGNQQLISVLNLGLHPMCDDLVSVGDARICREYPIEIMFCQNCLTAHQHYQVPKKDLFPSSYHYRSRFTADVLNGMKDFVASCEIKNGSLAGKKVLDIGCNDGSLLDFFREKGATTFGIEPTDAYLDAKEKNHCVYNGFFSEDLARQMVAEQGKPDIITFTNVFAHIENLTEVLSALKILSSSQTILVIENHYLGSILEGNQFDTFYHEHPRTYSYASFNQIAKTLGMSVLEVEFPSRYGGNIRVYMGEKLAAQSHPGFDLVALQKRESQFFALFNTMQTNLETWKTVKLDFLKQYIQKNGKLRAKAFPGRAAILVKLLGLNEDMISAVYEKPGSLKIGHYLPGTRIAIHSDDELFTLDKDLPILNLAWHISSEINAYMKKNGYQGEIFDILSAKDFALTPETV